MRKSLIGVLTGLALVLTPLSVPAEDTVVLAPQPDWQAVITAQIESLRDGDAASALMLSTQSFQVSYRDAPELFVDAIISAGYRPIIESRSHGFAEFVRTSPGKAAQLVRVVGRDWLVYNVVYDLVEETDGWRVKNVMLIDQRGVFI